MYLLVGVYVPAVRIRGFRGRVLREDDFGVARSGELPLGRACVCTQGFASCHASMSGCKCTSGAHSGFIRGRVIREGRWCRQAVRPPRLTGHPDVRLVPCCGKAVGAHVLAVPDDAVVNCITNVRRELSPYDSPCRCEQDQGIQRDVSAL